MNLVSVIIPAYNSANYIVDCLNSVLNQTYKNIEVIVVDDGSSDSTLDLVNEISASDTRLKVFSIVNSGVSVARQVGYDVCNGDWITFLDSDDSLNSSFIEGLIRISEGSDIVVSSYVEVYETFSLPYTVPEVLYGSLEIIDFISLHLNSCLIRAPWGKIFKKVGFLDQLNQPLFEVGMSLGEDTLFNLDVLSLQPDISVCPSSIYYWTRVNDNSLTKSASALEWIKFLGLYVERLENVCDLDSIRQSLEYDLAMKVGMSIDKALSCCNSEVLDNLGHIRCFLKKAPVKISIIWNRKGFVQSIKCFILDRSHSLRVSYFIIQSLTKVLSLRRA